MPAAAVGRLRRLIRLRRLSPVEQPLPESATAVAIIMDGNGRWARRRGLPAIAGHRAGTQALPPPAKPHPTPAVPTPPATPFPPKNWVRPPQGAAAPMAPSP